MHPSSLPGFRYVVALLFVGAALLLSLLVQPFLLDCFLIFFLFSLFFVCCFVSRLFVGAALLLSLLVQPFLPDGFLIFFLSAVMLSGWFGRTAAGLFAVVISMVAVDYFFIAPHWAFVMELDELPYFLSFLLSAVVTSWLGSARRSAEEKQKAHLDELFEQTPDAIMLVDLQDRILRVNKKFSHIFGYTADEIVNQVSTDLIVPAELKAEAVRVRQRLAAGEEVNLETTRRRKN